MYRVTLADQSTLDAKVVGFDQDKDVAVLRVDAPKEKLRPIPIGVSADLLVGQKVYAIGNPVSVIYTFLLPPLLLLLLVSWYFGNHQYMLTLCKWNYENNLGWQCNGDFYLSPEKCMQPCLNGESEILNLFIYTYCKSGFCSMLEQ